MRGAQRRRNPFAALAAASPFTAPDQRQCLEQGLKLLLLFKDGLRRRYHPTLTLRVVYAPRNDGHGGATGRLSRSYILGGGCSYAAGVC